MANLTIEQPLRLALLTDGTAIGPRGYSAYQIAVQNGFVGTIEEWLESLKGEGGPEGRFSKRYQANLSFVDAQIPAPGNLQIVQNYEFYPTTVPFTFACAAVVNERIGNISYQYLYADENNPVFPFQISWNPVENADYYIFWFMYKYPNGPLITDWYPYICVTKKTEILFSDFKEYAWFPKTNFIYDNFYPIENPTIFPAPEVTIDSGELGEVDGEMWFSIQAVNEAGILSKANFYHALLKWDDGNPVPCMASWSTVIDAIGYILTVFVGSQFVSNYYVFAGITQLNSVDLFELYNL